MNTRYLISFRAGLGLLAAGAFTAAVHAQTPLTVVNPSFENDYGYLGGTGASSVLGWSNGGVGGDAYGFIFYQDGTSFTAGFDGVNTTIVNGTMYQDLGVNFIPGNTYTLSFRLGLPPSISLAGGFTAGFVADAVGSFTALAPSSSDTIAGSSLPNGTLSTYTVSYTATSAVPVIVGFADFFAGANAPHLDLVQVSYTAIPEPSSTAALAGLAAIGLLAARRRARA